MRFVSLPALPLAPVLFLAPVLILVTASPALARGCVRGAAAGAVVGHVVGKGHAVLGAAGGCLVARHHYAKQARAQRAAAPHR